MVFFSSCSALSLRSVTVSFGLNYSYLSEKLLFPASHYARDLLLMPINPRRPEPSSQTAPGMGTAE